MTERTGKFLPVGLRFAAVFALDVLGNPKAVDVNPYVGLRWVGPTAFEITTPQARVITHPGRDSVIGISTLPSLESPFGTLKVSDYRFDIHSLVTGMVIGTVGEAKEIGHVTDLSGYEPLVGLLLYQQSQDLDSGEITWHSYVIPKCRCIPSASGMNANAGEISYQIVPKIVTSRLWGKTLVKASDGYSRAAFFEYDSEGLPAIVSWLGDGSNTEFNFPSGEEALSTDKIEVYQNRVLATGVTPALDGVTFSPYPATNDVITAWYEMGGEPDLGSV
jgi:hypothetical protein